MAAASDICAAVNPELEEERTRCSFEIIELTNLLDGGSSSTEERHEIERKFIEDPRFPRYAEYLGLSDDDYYSKGVEASINMQNKVEELGLDRQIPGNLQYVRSRHIGNIANPCGETLLTHIFMFLPTLMSQATEEMQAKWMPLVRKRAVIGTYCQTELGHGTNMKGLETTAIYDPQTQEFVLNSPTLTSLKFWPGGMGRTSNVAIVVAQLYTQGVHRGLHRFFVQLRSFEDHKPLPGVVVGEVGPKMSMNANDNGFLKLEHLRIPRTDMLMKHSQVLPDGTFVECKKSRGGHGTLIMARTAQVMELTLLLAQGATIAVRYSAVRRQGVPSNPGELEPKILDYQTQQYKLFPQVAMSYAGLFVFKQSFNKMVEFLANPSVAVACEVQAITSGLKALCTQNAADGIEVCRLSCGGLGYLKASRFPILYGFTTAACTYDGENTVLLLHFAQFLVKSYRAAKNGEFINSTAEYLDLTRNALGNNPLCADDTVGVLMWVFRKTVANLVSEIVCHLVMEENQKKKSAQEIWNCHSVELVKCARLYLQSFVLRSAFEVVTAEVNLSSSLKVVLSRLFEMLALYWIREGYGNFIQYGGVSASEMSKLNARLFALLEQLRPDIVGLVDAFDFRDEAIQSVLGCYDGRVYERIHEYLAQLPSNQVSVHSAYEKFLRQKKASKL